MELKYVNKTNAEAKNAGSNCTFMELKLAALNYASEAGLF